jgi:hypothetical protein
MRKSRFVYLIIFIVWYILTGNAQDGQVAEQSSPERLRSEMNLLKSQVDSLRQQISDLDSVKSDDVEHLEEQLDHRAQELENKIDALSRAMAPVVLNPRMTAFINFAARADNQTQFDASGMNEISNRFFLRTAELELRNAVDPYAEAILVMSVENEAGKDFSIDAEEAYGLIKRIPLLEDAPLGIKLKIGKFRAPFGINNKIHMHDLPWTTRPLIVSRFLGTEHGEFFESGFNPTGIDADFFLPNPIPQTTLEMNLDVVRAGELGLTQGGISGQQPAYISHITLSRDWNNEHLLILGASGYTEEHPSPVRLAGVDATYRWAPSEQRESRSLVAGGEAFFGRNVISDSLKNSHTNFPYGWYGYLQLQTSYWLYLGLKYDWLREPVNATPLTRNIALYASYYTTEFLRFRLGIEHRWSQIAVYDNTTTGIFEVNFVFGSHPTEPYWVNR